MTSEPVTMVDSTSTVAGIVGVAIVAAELLTYSGRPILLVSSKALDEARASLAIGDRQSAEQLYLNHVKTT